MGTMPVRYKSRFQASLQHQAGSENICQEYTHTGWEAFGDHATRRYQLW